MHKNKSFRGSLAFNVVRESPAPFSYSYVILRTLQSNVNIALIPSVFGYLPTIATPNRSTEPQIIGDRFGYVKAKHLQNFMKIAMHVI